MLGFLKHLFIPHHKNNHRAKILHHESLVIIILFVFASTFIFHNISRSHPEVLGISYSISESDLLNLVNQQRVANGLSSLSENSELDDAARRKAADMFQKNYWAHFAPDGSTSPWGFIRAAGYDYQYAGENLAKGFNDSGSIVTAWMNSPTHRENLLSSHYKDVGFAIVEGTLQGDDTVLVVQEFGSTAQENVAALPPTTTSSATNEQNIPTATPALSQAPIIIKAAQSSPIIPAESKIIKAPKIDSATASKNITAGILTFLGFGFILDMVIVERKKIPRIVGHNLDHIILVSLFVLFMIIVARGSII